MEQQELSSYRHHVALLQLILSSVLFGVCFVAQRKSMADGMSPITFTAARYVVSLVFLLILRPLIKNNVHSEVDKQNRTVSSLQYSANRMIYETFKWGSLCGLSSVMGSNLQQIGLVTVSAGKAAFYTALYVVLVPIVEFCLPGFGAKLNWMTWVSVIVSFLGAYLLSGCASDSQCFDISSNNNTHMGDLIVLVSTFCWVFSIIACDVATSRGVDGLSFTIIEFGVCTVVTLILSRIFEPKAWVDIIGSVSISGSMVIFVGITEALSFLCATLGQIYVDASTSSVIFSLESVVAAFGGYICLNEKLDSTELLGCMLLLGAVLFSAYGSMNDTGGKEDDGERRNTTGIEMAQMSQIVLTTTTISMPQYGSSNVGNTYDHTQITKATEQTRLIS